MKNSKQRRKSSRRSRSFATTIRAIILEGTGVVALILLISMVRSGNANPVENLRDQPAITDLKNWFDRVRDPIKKETKEHSAPEDFGSGYTVISGDREVSPTYRYTRESYGYPVRRADYRSFSQ